jgi:hypothetical protein
MRDRIAAWLRRVPKTTHHLVVRHGVDQVTECDVGAAELADELAQVCADYALAAGRNVNLTLVAHDAAGAAIARMPLRAYADVEEESARTAVDVVKLLAAHTQALTRTLVDSFREMLQAQRDIITQLGDRTTKAEEARERAEAMAREATDLAEQLAQKTDRQDVGTRLERLITAALPTGPRSGPHGGGDDGNGTGPSS